MLKLYSIVIVFFLNLAGLQSDKLIHNFSDEIYAKLCREFTK